MMRVQVQKWGNSLALRIPKSFATETALACGADVDLTVEAGRLVITPVPRQRYTLDELVASITPENRHAEISTGASVGDEAW
jgi:antitoxin MazE